MAVIPQMPVIKDILRSLSEQFGTAAGLISKQIQAVVRHQVDDLSNLIEQQNTVNTTISGLEEELRQTLILTFNGLKIRTKEYSITTLMPYCDPSDTEIIDLRNELKENIKQTQTKQVHLLQLLQFAQEHVTETIKAVFQFSESHSTHYQSSGKKATPRMSSRLINQTA